MRMSRCIIGLAASLMVAVSAQAFAVTGERVATLEEYPALHSKMQVGDVGVQAVCVSARMCESNAASAGTDMNTDSGTDARTLASALASLEVAQPVPASITKAATKANF